MNKAQQEKIKTLSAALEDGRSLIHERNVEIIKLRSAVQNHELTIDILQDELAQIHELTDREHAKHNDEVEDLVTQIKQLQERDKSNISIHEHIHPMLGHHITHCSPCVSHLHMQIKTVVRNVICHLVPSMTVDKLRLPGKSCAAYMRSREMPTISRVQKASELMEAE